VFNVVVEITKGSKVKYELDKKTGMIKVRLDPSRISFSPLDRIQLLLFWFAFRLNVFSS
jgi:inorganic pyrophosphatase